MIIFSIILFILTKLLYSFSLFYKYYEFHASMAVWTHVAAHPFILWVAAQAVRGLAFRRSHVRGSLSAASLVICSPHCSVQNVALIGYCTVFCGGCDQSIGSTVSDAIVRSWLWSTATRSSPLGHISKLLQVVDN